MLFNAFRKIVKNGVVIVCLYLEQNNTLLLVDMESLISWSTLYQVDTRREIRYLRSPMNCKNNMYLLTEWEGRTGKYLARGQGVRPDREPNIFPSVPTLVNKHFII